MKIFAAVELRKPRGMDASGIISLGFTPRPLKTFKIAVFDGNIKIKGEKVDLEFSDIPLRQELKSDQERAIANIFAEVVFGPLQRIYEKTSPVSLHRFKLENEISTRLIHEESSGKVYETRSETETIELRKLMGRFPNSYELEYMEKSLNPQPFRESRY